MKKVLFVLLLFIATIGNMSAKTKYYTCNFKLEEQTTDKGYVYKDSTILISFSLSETQIGFILQNLTKKPMFIDWDQSALILNESTERCIHSGIKYNEKDNAMPKSVIAPNASLKDLLLPASHVYFNSESYKSYYRNPHWEFTKIVLLESHNKEQEALVFAQEGMKIGIMLALEINGVIDYKYFNLICYNFKEKK